MSFINRSSGKYRRSEYTAESLPGEGFCNYGLKEDLSRQASADGFMAQHFYNAVFRGVLVSIV